MDIVEYRDYCLSFSGVTEDFPFDEQTLVFKVKGKMFALTNVDHFTSFNAKAAPEDGIALREQYAGIKPGYHMNKKHWNTIAVDGSVPDAVMRDLLKNSYDLVVKGLTKKQREELSKTQNPTRQ